MRKTRMIASCCFLGLLLLFGGLRLIKLEYSYQADPEEAAARYVSPAALHAWEQNGSMPADAVSPEKLEMGRKAFYGETFGNEVYFTDIMGAFNGVLTLPNVEKACLRLRGKGTTNLLVEAAKDAVVGGRAFRKGELMETGLDVAVGAYTPIGVTIKAERGRLRAGIGCIMCHGAADLSSGKVIEGVPNGDINAGLLLALSTNSASFFTHTDVKRVQDFIRDRGRVVPTSDGGTAPLPDPQALEDAVDRALLKWPRGSVDTMIDLENGPVQIPDTFTAGDYPYSWNGAMHVGPFRGLAFLSGIPNAQNMDPLSQAELSQALFGVDKEVYMGTILQNAASAKFRYKPSAGRKPSEFFAKIDPTPGAPGVNELVPGPEFPRPSGVTITGLLASKPGYTIAEHLLALAAFQNTLQPPAPPLREKAAVVAAGRDVFVKANCMSCHAGAYLTNNKVIPLSEIKTEPVRAQVFKKQEPLWGSNLMYDWDTPVPLPDGVRTHRLEPTDRLALAHGTEGGYKVPSLLGLLWSAPYLHDGGVAAGAELDTELGVPGTLYRGRLPDPVNSLKALLDRRLRQRVVEANSQNGDAASANIRGIGHEYWVDEQAGFTKQQQEGLIRYLLQVAGPGAK